MKASTWAPPLVFVATAVPTVLLLNAFDVGGEYRIWVALVVGMAATAYTQHRVTRREQREEQP